MASTKKYKDPKTPSLGKKSSWKPAVGTKRTSSGVVGGPVKAASRTGGVLRSQRRGQK